MEQSSIRGLYIGKMAKNNNTLLDVVSLKGQHLAPVVYMQNYYEAFKAGIPLERIAEVILEEISKDVGEMGEEVEKIRNYESVSEQIFPALINRKSNEEYLKTVPFRNFLDLAQIYKVCLNADEETYGHVTVSDAILNYWGITKEELHEKAIAQRFCSI